MRTLRPLLIAALLLAQAWAHAQPAAAAGQSIYREGVRASGAPVQATARNGIAMSGSAAACVNCHRRSGLGGAEGQSRIRPIAGRVLFSPSESALASRWGMQARAGARPAYTAATLARALREGVDPTGRPLDPLMPRYALDDDDVAQLQSYLAGLSATSSPGVTDREIHFATILAPGLEARLRQSLLDVMQGFFRDKNGGTRQEAKRRTVGTEAGYLAYRTWVLHVWELQGEPHGWRAQLEALYRQQPVFAVIGGLGRSSWQPVHAFCEAAEVPCVFPDIDHPVEQGAGHYSLYLSRGVALEADVLARQLAQAQGAGRIVQVFRDDELGRMPAGALRRALQRLGLAADLVDAPLDPGRPLDGTAWPFAPVDPPPATLIAWLRADEVRALASRPPSASLESFYLSASLAGIPEPAEWAPGWRERTRIVHLFDAPGRESTPLARLQAWLRMRRLAVGDARTQANAWFAVTLSADAIGGLGENFSREYFIERLEQMVESSPNTSLYPRLSLGPGQRFASRGGYILGFPPAGGPPRAISDWLVP